MEKSDELNQGKDGWEDESFIACRQRRFIEGCDQETDDHWGSAGEYAEG